MALKPGTDVTIQGTGFYPQTWVEFGNPYAEVHPSSISADGTVMHVNVPRLATTGPLTLLTANGGLMASNGNLPPFQVNSFRNTDGYAFPNPSLGTYTYADLEQLFGHQAVYGGNNEPTGYAKLFLKEENDFYGSDPKGKGQCYGMSLSSQRLVEGKESYSKYPLQPGLTNVTNPTVWDLDGPGLPSPALENYIHLQQLVQDTSESLSAVQSYHKLITWDYMGNPSLGVYTLIKDALLQGEFPLLSISAWDYKQQPDGTWAKSGYDGHTVVAYNLEDDGSGTGGFYIDVYDSNVPFSTAENAGTGSMHAVREGYNQGTTDWGSRIHITWNGWWSFPDLTNGYAPAPQAWSGAVTDNMYIVRPSALPVQPHFAMTSNATSTLRVDGAAQVAQITDAAGHTRLNPDGTLNLDPATATADVLMLGHIDAAAPGAPYFVLGGTGPYTVTMRGTGGGSYGLTLLNSRLAASFESVATAQGQQDTLTFDPKGTVQFATTAASKALTVQLMAHAADGSEYDAVLTTRTAGGSIERLGFDATGRAFTYAHTGATTKYRLALDGYDRKGRAVTLVTASLPLKSGQTASFQAVDWARLKTKGVQLTLTQGNGRHQYFLLKNGRAPVRLARPVVRIKR
jgi:hypothetical protein